MHNYFFDTNIYRRLTTSENGGCFKKFIESIEKDEIISKINSKNIAIKMTPFSIMEAVGITVPSPQINLPEDITNQINVKELIRFLINQATLFYENSSVTKKQHFLDRAKEQSKYTSLEAKKLEEICINYPLSKETFEGYLLTCLAFDYICKYNYNPIIQNLVMREFFIPSFFIENKLASVSKFRLIKRIWDIFYSKLLTANDSTTEIQNTVKSMGDAMRLKKDKDYLDCELVHLVTTGDFVENTYRPVVAFTCDDEEKIKLRVIIYKSTINLLNNDILKDKYSNVINSWQEGIIVFCNEDGTFKNVVEVNKLEIFQL